jgi:hypothetical protein
VKKCTGALEDLEKIQVLVVGTEWPEFKDLARQIPNLANSDLLVIDANRHLQESLMNTPIAYLSVGSKPAY